MTPILTFTRDEFDREVARLGARRIGEARNFNGGRRARAIWSIWLPDKERKNRPEDSMFSARSAIVRAVNEWLLETGIFYPGQSVEIKIDGEDDDDQTREARTG
jgi:hypothetical protein